MDGEWGETRTRVVPNEGINGFIPTPNYHALHVRGTRRQVRQVPKPGKYMICGRERRTVQFITWVCITTFYLRLGGHVIIVVCLFVCSLATLRKKNFRTDLHEIFSEGWQWANEQRVKFWWRSGSPSGCRDCFLDS